MFHRVEERVAIQNVHVHVIPRRAEERVKHASQISDSVFCDPPQPLRKQRRGQGNPVGRIAEGYFGDRGGRGVELPTRTHCFQGYAE